MKYFTILFDFDGTIADTAAVSLSVIDSLGCEFGFRPSTAEEVPTLRQLPARRLLKERLGISPWNVIKLLRFDRRFREEIAKRADEMHLVEGMDTVLNALKKNGYELGIVTSKSKELVVKLLDETGVEVNFIDAGSGYFSKTRAIKRTIREYDLDRSRTVYIGDELRDFEACKKGGIDFVGVGWGFNAPEALRAAGARVMTTPGELVVFLSSQEQWNRKYAV